jgi:hypothetical protein
MHSKTPYLFVFNLSSAFGWPEGRAGYRYNDLALGSERHGPCCPALSGLVTRRSLVSPWRVSCEQILANPGVQLRHKEDICLIMELNSTTPLPT